MRKLNELTIKELREVAKIHNISGRWEMNKKQLVNELFNIGIEIIFDSEEEEKEIQEKKEKALEEQEYQIKKEKELKIKKQEELKKLIIEEYKRLDNIDVQEVREAMEKEIKINHKKEINIYKDGKLIKTIESLIETMKWAADNNICNNGWIKESLKTGRETVAGRKFKEGGYKFEYIK